MRKLILCFFLLVLPSTSYSQQSTAVDTTLSKINNDLKLMRTELSDKIGRLENRLNDDKSLSWIFTIVLPAILPLLSVIAGAKYAFSLHAREKEKEILSQKIAAGNRAIHSLYTISNKLANFNDQHLEKYKNDKSAFINMRGLIVPLKHNIDLDFGPISFLFETKFRNLLGEISIGLEKYQSTIELIDYRSNLHIEKIQPLLDKEGVAENSDITREKTIYTLGRVNFSLIKNSTDYIFTLTPSTITYLKDITNKLSNALEKLFPRNRNEIIKVVWLENRVNDHMKNFNIDDTAQINEMPEED